MNSCCLNTYIINEEELSDVKKLEIDSSSCNECYCYCGYIQYESLAPYMPKLINTATKDEDYLLLEAKLREQIIEISRLFDAETKVVSGYYSKSHFSIVKLYGDGSSRLSIPDFVSDSLELYTESGYLINPETYYYKDGYLVIKPCTSHSNTCGCSNTCGSYISQVHKFTRGWEGTFQAKARFGNECADMAVRMAVKAYLIEYNTFGDQQEATRLGYPVTRSFRKPDVWITLVKKYTEGKRLNHYFGFA